MSTNNTPDAMRRPVSGAPAGASPARLPLAAVGMSLGLLFAITYALCVLYGVVISDAGMHQLLPMLLPGFTWLTWPSFLLGLAWSFLYGWYAALVFVPLFNYFAARFDRRQSGI